MYTHVSVDAIVYTSIDICVYIYAYIAIYLYECVCGDAQRSWFAINVPRYPFKGQTSASRLFVNTASKTFL